MIEGDVIVGEVIDFGIGVSDSCVDNDSMSFVVGSGMMWLLDWCSVYVVCCEYFGNDVGGFIVDDECKV